MGTDPTVHSLYVTLFDSTQTAPPLFKYISSGSSRLYLAIAYGTSFDELKSSRIIHPKFQESSNKTLEDRYHKTYFSSGQMLNEYAQSFKRQYCLSFIRH